MALLLSPSKNLISLESLAAVTKISDIFPPALSASAISVIALLTRGVPTLSANCFMTSLKTIYSKPSINQAKLAYVDESVVLDLISPTVTDGWIKVKSTSVGLEGFIKANEVWGI